MQRNFPRELNGPKLNTRILLKKNNISTKSLCSQDVISSAGFLVYLSNINEDIVRGDFPIGNGLGNMLLLSMCAEPGFRIGNVNNQCAESRAALLGSHPVKLIRLCARLTFPYGYPLQEKSWSLLALIRIGRIMHWRRLLIISPRNSQIFLYITELEHSKRRREYPVLIFRHKNFYLIKNLFFILPLNCRFQYTRMTHSYIYDQKMYRRCHYCQGSYNTSQISLFIFL